MVKSKARLQIVYEFDIFKLKPFKKSYNMLIHSVGYCDLSAFFRCLSEIIFKISLKHRYSFVLVVYHWKIIWRNYICSI